MKFSAAVVCFVATSCSILLQQHADAFSPGYATATATATATTRIAAPTQLQQTTTTNDALPAPITKTIPTVKSNRQAPRRKKKKKPKGPAPLARPENVPSLSEIMAGVTADDLNGNTVNAREPQSPRPKKRASRPARGEKKQVYSRPKSNKKTEVKTMRPRNMVSNEPYRAPYQVSLKTQSMLKATASRLINRPDHERAEAVLAALLKTPPEQINEANVVCALTLSAKCMTPSVKLTKTLRNSLLQVLDILNILVSQGRLKARQLCNAVYAIAKHYNKDHTLLPSPAEATALSSEEMVGVAEAWILQNDHDDNTPEHRLEATVEAIANRLAATLDDTSSNSSSSPRKPNVGEISMACWAYGVLRQRVRPPGWEVPPQLSRLPVKHVPRPSLLNNVQVVTFEQWAVSPEDGNQELVATHEPVGKMFDAFAKYLCEEHGNDDDDKTSLVQEMSWSEIANVAWAFANHGHCRTEASETFMNTLSREGAARLEAAGRKAGGAPFLPRDVSQLVWSIGTLQSDNFRLGDDLVGLIESIATYWLVDNNNDAPFKRWSNADLVQLAIALAHSRIDHIPLLRTLFKEAHSRVLNYDRDTFHEWEVSVLLWVQARLYLKEDQGEEFQNFAQAAPKWLMRRAQGVASLEDIGIGAQEQANLAWSLTVLEEYDSPDTLALLKAIFKEAATAGTKNEYIQLEHAHQLWQALYLTKFECPEAVEHVPVWFSDFLKEKWSVEKARHKISSARHRSLSRTLDFMGVAHYNEHDEDIDVAIVLKENAAWTGEAKKTDHTDAQFKVALEFDGPLHFTREAYDESGKKIDPRALGHTALKYRLLKRQGWAVVRVPYYEFDKIPYWASMERQRYLQRLLKTHANIRFSEVDISEYKAIAPNRLSRFD